MGLYADNSESWRSYGPKKPDSGGGNKAQRHHVNKENKKYDNVKNKIYLKRTRLLEIPWRERLSGEIVVDKER